MSIICLTRGLSLIGICVIWVLNLVLVLKRIMANIIRYTGYIKFIKYNNIDHTVLLIIVRVLLLCCLNVLFLALLRKKNIL